MDIENLEKIDSLIISKLILEKMNIKYSPERIDKCAIEKSKELKDILAHIEKIEDEWGVVKSDDGHSFGRKEKNETIKIWSVPSKSAQVLENLVTLTNSKNILEVGTSAGYAALHLASGARKK